MKRDCAIKSWILALAAIPLLAGTAAANQSDAGTSAGQILDATGVQGGIVVHLGCGDGKLTAALRVSDRYTIHGLERDPARVVEARSQRCRTPTI